MLRALRTWLHEHDPLLPLAFEGPLAAIEAQVAGGERYFERLLKRHLVDNCHRTVLVLKPDRDLAECEAQEERAAARGGARQHDRAGSPGSGRSDEYTFRRTQEQPGALEALATIPTLTLSGLPRANKLIPCEVTSLSDTRVLYHDLFTNGVVCLDVGFDLHILPSELLPYVPLFGRALLETGVGNDDFVRLSQRIGRSTGGIRPQRWTSTVAGGVTSTAWLNLRGKALPNQTVELLSILQDILGRARLDCLFMRAFGGGQPHDRQSVRRRDFLGDLFAFAQRLRVLAHSPKLPVPSGPYFKVRSCRRDRHQRKLPGDSSRALAVSHHGI